MPTITIEDLHVELVKLSEMVKSLAERFDRYEETGFPRCVEREQRIINLEKTSDRRFGELTRRIEENENKFIWLRNTVVGGIITLGSVILARYLV